VNLMICAEVKGSNAALRIALAYRAGLHERGHPRGRSSGLIVLHQDSVQSLLIFVAMLRGAELRIPEDANRTDFFTAK